MTTRVTEGARRERHNAYFIGSGYAGSLSFLSAACKRGYISPDFALFSTLVARRQRGGAVRALDYSLLDLFSVVPRSNPQPRLYNSQLVHLQATCWDF